MIRSDSGLIFFLSPVASVIALSATAEEINRAPPPLRRSSAESFSATGRWVGVEWEGSMGSARGILNASLCTGFTALKEESGGLGGGKGRLRNIEREARPRHCVTILYKMSQTLFFLNVFFLFFFLGPQSSLHK